MQRNQTQLCRLSSPTHPTLEFLLVSFFMLNLFILLIIATVFQGVGENSLYFYFFLHVFYSFINSNYQFNELLVQPRAAGTDED